jgi:GTP cyclohydrolase I
LQLAESWDNCGLQIGSRAWPVNRIWIALDPLPEVVHAAVHAKVDLLITHHPLIFHPIKSIDLQTPVGRTIENALNASMGVYSAHTNLDSAGQGVNDALAGMIGITDTEPLVPAAEKSEGAPHEPRPGLGRVGRLSDGPMKLKVLIEQIKIKFSLESIKYTGSPDLKVERAAVCSGSGSGLLQAFLSTSAQVYVSGDLRYHDARIVQEAGRALIDIGHFHSEHLVLGPLAGRLRDAASAKGWPVDIQVCPLESDPFAFI